MGEESVFNSANFESGNMTPSTVKTLNTLQLLSQHQSRRDEENEQVLVAFHDYSMV